MFFKVLILTCLSFWSVNGAKILGIFPFGLKSHYIIFESLLLELAKRGHDVTSINTFPREEKIANYAESDVGHCYVIPKNDFGLETAYSYGTSFSVLPRMFSYVSAWDEIFECAPMKTLKNTKEKYDLIFVELFSSDATLAYAHILNAPFVGLCANSLYPWAADRLGNPDNPSYVTFNHHHIPLKSRWSTLSERFYNTMAYLYAKWMHKTQSEAETDRIVRKHFGDDFPPISEIARNTSMVFTYTHHSINGPKPLLPKVVEIGGIQIKTAKPLPKKIQNFIEESKHGVIYFCLGSLLQAETLPQSKRDAFVKVFSRLPQRVLWKWENSTLPGKTDNIMIDSWLPQRDILAHKNISLFISHGGALGINEAVYEGVPILGIPIFGDQNINLKRIEENGAGLILPYNEITPENIEFKIQTILNNTSYKDAAALLSRRYRDRPMSAMESAVYWTEYVIRNKGTHHLESPSQHLFWYQYLLIDIAAIICGIVAFCAWAAYILLRIALGKSAPKNTQKRKKKLKNL